MSECPTCGGNCGQCGLPPGWRAVPEEPTEEMIEAGDDLIPVTRGTESYLIGRGRNGAPENIFRAMLSAAPPAPASDVAELVRALEAAKGYMLNAKIDLETGTKKATTICTLEGGLKMLDAALSKFKETNNG